MKFSIHFFIDILKLSKIKKGQTFVLKRHLFLILFLNFIQLPAAKKGFKNGASQQTFGPSFFVRALQQDPGPIHG
jgi:hypothetical protein